MTIDKLQQLEYKDLPVLRQRLHEEQGGVCPIIGKKFKVEDMVVDHKHKSSSEQIGVNGASLIRGVIHFQVNAWEGKITNSFIRWGLAKFGVSLPMILRNLADYLEKTPLPLIHPTEKPKSKILGKRLYAKIKKAHIEKYPNRKVPPYPLKRPILSKKWLDLIQELNINEE